VIESQPKRILGLGILGLGGAAVNMLPAFRRSEFLKLVAAADIDPEIRSRFLRDHAGATAYESAERLCDDPAIELVYIATPNRLHFAHAMAAIERGKHVLIEKPMAVTLDEADRMIAAAERHRALLAVNVKHSFEPRIRRIREFVLSGELGRLLMIHNWRFTDWLYRPRTPEEITPGFGNGILWRQGPHQFDIVRTIGGGLVRSLRATTQVFDPARRVAGAFSAFLEFQDGCCATVIQSGYDHFSSRSLVFGFDGANPLSDPARYARARRKLLEQPDSAAWELSAAAAERYGGGRRDAAAETRKARQPNGWILGGPLVASFERGDVRLSANGLIVDGDTRQCEIPLDPGWDGRDGRLRNLFEAIVGDRPLIADGRWGKATQEVLLAVEESSAKRAEVMLSHQIASVDASPLPAQSPSSP
jgi:phthalate 4,5-cis-dihydrodiol dehydrogenase